MQKEGNREINKRDLILENSIFQFETPCNDKCYPEYDLTNYTLKEVFVDNYVSGAPAHSVAFVTLPPGLCSR
jgi:hypothetical protein